LSLLLAVFVPTIVAKLKVTGYLKEMASKNQAGTTAQPP
jgi:hypothetical protein